VLFGIVAAVIACLVLAGIVYALYFYNPNVMTVLTWQVLAITAVAVFFFGIIITAICAYISVSKFLRMRASELYKI
jgi:cell division transport system permease protein